MAVQYQLEMRLAGAPTWAPVGSWQSGLSLAVGTSGTPPGNYEFRVTARDLATGATSSPSAPRAFTVTHGVLYDGQYRLAGAAAWISLFADQSVLSFAWSTTGLLDGDYEVQVQAHAIIGGAQSFWSAPVQFTVLHPGSGGGGGGPNSVIEKDDVSIAMFGRRYMRLVEDASSNINTAPEADRMALAALADLATPPVEQGIETLFFWPAEIGDLYLFEANGVHYDQDQAWYVKRLTHALRGGSGRTTIETRGKPIGAHADWLARQAGPTGSPVISVGPGVGPTLSVSPDPQPDFYDITWSATGSVRVFKDGVLIATPANVFRVLRLDLPHVYEFQASLNGQLISDTVTVAAYGVDVITPDLNVTPGTLTSTTLAFNTSATNPAAAHIGFITPAMIPLVTMTLSGCTAVGFSGSGPHGLNEAGQVVTINRPAFSSAPASVLFEAEIVGGGSEVIVVTIPNQDKLSFGPSYSVAKTGETLNATTIVWSMGSGVTVRYREIDPFTGPQAWTTTPPTSPITRGRQWDATNAWPPLDVQEFEFTKDGQVVNVQVSVPFIDPPYIRNFRVISLNPTTDALQLGWDGLIELGYTAVQGTYRVHLTGDSQNLLTPQTVTGLTTNSHTFNGLGFVPKGTTGAVLTTALFTVEHFHGVFGTLVTTQLAVAGWVT